MSILLSGSIAIFLLVKGLLNKFVFLLKNLGKYVIRSWRTLDYVLQIVRKN